MKERSKELLSVGADRLQQSGAGRQTFFASFFQKRSAFFLSLLLSSCNLAPPYHATLTRTPARYAEETTFQPAHPADAIPRGAWWTLFADPTLNRLEAKIDPANATLAAALASYQRARAFAAEAAFGLYPQLSVGGDVGYNRQSDNRPLRGRNQPNEYMDSTATAQASYEIDLWGRVANAVKAGREAAQASAADLQSLRLSLHAELAADYATLRGDDAQSRVLQNAVTSYEKGLAITQNRFAGKISPGMDVSRAQTQLAAARAALTDTTERRALAEHAIAILVGKLPAELHIPPADWALRQPAIDAGLPSTLLERRPDVAAAERAMAAANAEIGVTRAAFYPSLSLNLLYGFQNTAINPFSLPDELWGIGPGLAMPLFEGGLRNAEQAAAMAAYRQALANYRQTVLGAFQQVEDSLAAQHLLGQEMTQERQAVDAARRTVAMTTSLYKDGGTNYLDVVVAQTSELQSEQTLVNLRTRHLIAAIDLVRDLGGGWTKQDLPSLSQIAGE